MGYEIMDMKKKGIYIFVIAAGVVLVLIAMTLTLPGFRRTRLGRIVRHCLGDGLAVQRADDLAEDIEKKIGAEKLQAWCEETMTRYKANELLTDGNSPYWSAGNIKLADEEIPEFIKNVWPKQPAPNEQKPDVSIRIDTNGNPEYMAISWYLHGVMVGSSYFVVTHPYFYLIQVKPGIYVYVIEK